MKALYDFDPQYSSDLRFSKGDIIRVQENQSGQSLAPGWFFGEVNGRKGVVPGNYCLKADWMRAQHNFDPQYEGDLRLSAGDLIQVMDDPNSNTLPHGWLIGQVNERRGMFPSNYCEVVALNSEPSNTDPIHVCM